MYDNDSCHQISDLYFILFCSEILIPQMDVLLKNLHTIAPHMDQLMVLLPDLLPHIDALASSLDVSLYFLSIFR